MTCKNIETGECTILVVWDPPGIDRESIKHYMIYINGTFQRNTSDHHHNNITYSNSLCVAFTVSVCAVNDCDLVGPRAQMTSICTDIHDMSTTGTNRYVPPTNNGGSVENKFEGKSLIKIIYTMCTT